MSRRRIEHNGSTNSIWESRLSWYRSETLEFYVCIKISAELLTLIVTTSRDKSISASCSGVGAAAFFPGKRRFFPLKTVRSLQSHQLTTAYEERAEGTVH